MENPHRHRHGVAVTRKSATAFSHGDAITVEKNNGSQKKKTYFPQVNITRRSSTNNEGSRVIRSKGLNRFSGKALHFNLRLHTHQASDNVII